MQDVETEKAANCHLLWGARDMIGFSSSSGCTERESLAATKTVAQIMPNESSSEAGDHIPVTEAGDHEKGRRARIRARPNKTSRLKLKRLVNSAEVVSEPGPTSFDSHGSSLRARYYQNLVRVRTKEQSETETVATASSTAQQHT
eukprot:NODE_22714_length_697_cov_8.633333.p1 GENE.NODE_22714_length_697_cov_8.633333~~NODE_22714_length_697_cov_8.633333.p1  ORF type:complete len:145 (-),score=6.40 NODE_22714_length_697_cov_8.633333:176-610(-)